MISRFDWRAGLCACAKMCGLLGLLAVMAVLLSVIPEFTIFLILGIAFSFIWYIIYDDCRSARLNKELRAVMKEHTNRLLAYRFPFVNHKTD